MKERQLTKFSFLFICRIDDYIAFDPVDSQNIAFFDLKEQTQLKNLADDLKAHVIGQDNAVDRVAKAIRRNRVGLNKQNRPIGCQVMCGPTGVFVDH
ncbi:hypothetical protein EfmJHP10_09320 [Enterococcus faecium]|nr:hypothetical protein EfmJHP10_09320 [Enterococcus faecium]